MNEAAKRGGIPFFVRSAAMAVALILAAAPAAAQAPTIDQIKVERRSVFDPDELGFWPLRIVNKLHVTTRPYVVRRELLFAEGEAFDSARVAESERNLRRLRIFRLVDIDTVRTDSGLVMNVITRDAWSTNFDLRFRSTGGSVDYTIAVIEENLLGTATQTSLLYRDSPDRTTTTLGFRQPRLINNVVGLAARVEDRSDGELLAGSFGKPFFSLADRFNWLIEGDTRTERILRFRDGFQVARDTLQRRFVLGRIGAGRALRASSTGYLRAGVMAQMRRDDFVAQASFDTLGFQGRSTTGAIGGWIESRRARFLKTRGYNSISRDEDIDISTLLRAEVWVAPESFGYRRTGIGPDITARTGVRLPSGFATVGLTANGLFTSDGLDSGSVILAGTVGWLPSPRHLAVFHGTVGAIRNELPGSEFDFGLGVGPRAFREHAFTGDRSFFFTAEYRYGIAPDFMNVVDVGIATFADVGGAWFQGEGSRTGGNIGMGLRLGSSRSSELEANRLDLAYRLGNDREPAGWVFVVSKGFAFGGGLRGR